jgi:hypothetical protein
MVDPFKRSTLGLNGQNNLNRMGLNEFKRYLAYLLDILLDRGNMWCAQLHWLLLLGSLAFSTRICLLSFGF